MIEIEIEDEEWSRSLTDPVGLTRQATLAAIGQEARGVAIVLTDDETLRGLNLRFLGQDRPTNVLAFPDLDARRLGDVALAYGVCAREAAEQHKPLPDHLRHLVIHGVLHLMGYDHQGDEDAARMEAMERVLLARMGIPNPYDEALR